VRRNGLLAARMATLALALLAALGVSTGDALGVDGVRLRADPDLVADRWALADPTVMQSFAYDAVHRTFFFVQRTRGASRTSGDLTITRLNASGRIRGAMRLRGFGHGVSIGVEPHAHRVFLWTEAVPRTMPARVFDALPKAARAVIGNGAGASFGTKIARFRWRKGGTIRAHSAGVRIYRPNPHSTNMTASVDMATRTITIRYLNPRGTFRYAVYRLPAFKHGSYAARRRFSEPRPTAVFQGWTARAGLVFRLEGSAYSGTNPPPGDALVTAFTAEGVAAARTTAAGARLSYREPEGMATVRGKVCYGFASGPPGGRRASVYCTP
jgi:hypothetical protein